jgi:predicted RNA-binding Zn-ribbon protein involved in translation (DUF1610 family)
MTRKVRKYIKCVLCGERDFPTLHEDGTDTKMHCPDCGMPTFHTCRKCCPTHHKDARIIDER